MTSFPANAVAERFTSDEAWLSWRAEEDSVGGSQVPKLLGLHPFTTPISSASSGAGHALEPLVLARAARIRRWSVVEQGWCVKHATESWRRGSLDAVVFQGGSPVLVLEVKVVFLGQFKHWRDGLPDYVLLQAIWYMNLTGLPVVVCALLVPAWGIGAADPETLAECSELRFHEVTPAEHGERADLVVDAVREVRAGRLAVAAYQAPPADSTPEGTFDDGVLAARWLSARAAVRDAAVAARHARSALRAAEAGYDAISERLRSRVGSGESLLAGGWRISVGKNGAIRVR